MQPSALPAANFSVGPWNRSAVHQLQKEHREICVCVRISLNKFVFHFTSSAFILRYELSPIDVCASFAWVKANSDKLCFIPFSIAGSISGGCWTQCTAGPWAGVKSGPRVADGEGCSGWGAMRSRGQFAFSSRIPLALQAGGEERHRAYSTSALADWYLTNTPVNTPTPPILAPVQMQAEIKGLSCWVRSPKPIAPRYPLEASTAQTSQGKGLSRWHIPGTGFVRKSEILRSNL